MEIADHIACLRSEGELLAEAAERSSLSAPVPTCPGWRVRDLLAHLGFVHRWATSYVADGRTEMTPEPGEEQIIRLAPADESLVGWFRDGHARLVSVLAGADPDVRCWAFLPAPSPLAFWARRQAHETAIHRADAQLAAAAGPGGDLDPFPAGLAADGLDELLMGFGGRNPGSLSDAPAVLVIRAEEGAAAAEWTVVMGQPRAGVSRGLDPAAGLADPGAAGPADPGAAGPADPGAAGPADPGAAGPADPGAAGPPDPGAAGPADAAVGPAEASPPGPPPAYCRITGPAAALYLLLWNRGTAAGLDVRGDAGVLATWRENMRVRWH